MQSRIRCVASWLVVSLMCMGIAGHAASAAAFQEGQSASPQDAVSGEWLITRDAYGIPLYQKMTLKLENGKVTGNLAGDKLEGTLDGNALHFIARDEDNNTSEFTGMLSGGAIAGTMTLQEFLLQCLGDKESTRPQALENLRKVAHQATLVCAFQNAERSRKRQVAAERDGAADLFVDQENLRAQRLRQ